MNSKVMPRPTPVAQKTMSQKKWSSSMPKTVVAGLGTTTKPRRPPLGLPAPAPGHSEIFNTNQSCRIAFWEASALGGAGADF